MPKRAVCLAHSIGPLEGHVKARQPTGAGGEELRLRLTQASRTKTEEDMAMAKDLT